MGADEEVDLAGFDVIIKCSERILFFVVAVEAGDFGFREEATKFSFEEFGAKAFMDNVGTMAIRATSGNFFFVTTDVTSQKITVSMKDHGEITFWAKGLPTAIFAECKG